LRIGSIIATLTIAVAALSTARPASSQEPPGFIAGTPLGVAVEGEFRPMSANVKVYGAVVNAESCSYDSVRDLIVVVNRGTMLNQVPNDGFISLLNHDGSVHTARWIGVNRNDLVLNYPLGSEVWSGRLYVADRDGGTGPADPSVSVIRWFDMETGAPSGSIRVEDSGGFNDIGITDDGTIYASDTGASRLYEVRPDGSWRVLIDGAPLDRPNGVDVDDAGNIVVVNAGDTAVLTFSRAGALLNTEHAAQPGSDGIVIMPDGTKYVSSVQQGGVSRIRPGRAAELIATNIPSAASMCYDGGANQLVIPMNQNNGIAIVPLD
jgi:hypothetical protein